MKIKRKPKPIGIIGGAGPLAGVYLLNRLFTLAQQRYGCHEDADFPHVFLNSYPFSDMLSERVDFRKIREELSECIRAFEELLHEWGGDSSTDKEGPKRGPI